MNKTINSVISLNNLNVSNLYVNERGILINDDCMKILPLISDKSINLILADLPYGTTKCKWDKVLNFSDLWYQYRRILTETGTILLFSSQPFTTDLINSSRDWFKYEIIWDKGHGTDFQLSNIKPMKSHENILVFAPKKTTYNKQMIKADKPLDTTNWKLDKRNKHHNNCDFKVNIKKVYDFKHPTTVIRYSMSNAELNNTKRLHPTQKPLFIMNWLISTYSNENEVVLDNTMGVGSTCISANDLGRNFIGIEQEKEYFELACKRFNELPAAKFKNEIDFF